MNEALSRMVGADPNMVCICIDRAEGDNQEGRLFHRYRRDEIPFHSTNTLIREMDNLFDQIDFPQASTRQRSFSSQKAEARTKKEVLQMQKTEDLLEHSGNMATFVVNVKYRQNATWQGEIIWAEKKEKLYFRSALEMLKLIDSALDEGKQSDR